MGSVGGLRTQMSLLGQGGGQRISTEVRGGSQCNLIDSSSFSDPTVHSLDSLSRRSGARTLVSSVVSLNASKTGVRVPHLLGTVGHRVN